MTANAPTPANSGDEWGWRDAVWAGFAGGIGALLAFGILLAIPPLNHPSVAWIIGVLVLSLTNLSLGATAYGGFVETFGGRRSRFHTGDKILMWLVVAGLLVLDLTVAWRLFSSHTFLPWGFLIGAGVAVIAGFFWSAQRAWPNGTHGKRTTWVDDFSFLSGGIGLVLGVVVALALLVGSAVYHTHFEKTDGPTPPLVTSISGGYVALGDSYSAGEGLEPWATMGIYGKSSPYATLCHRSATQGYPELLEGPNKMQALLARPDSLDQTCSGAITEDVYVARRDSDVKDPQVGPGPHPGVGLVTLTMGGNDMLFSTVVLDCIFHGNCMTSQFKDSPSDPVPTQERVPDGVLQSAWAPQREITVANSEGALFAQLRKTFPRPTRIVVIGYPYLFPLVGARLPLDCFSELRLVSTQVRHSLRQLQDDFTTLTYEEAAINDVEFVSPIDVWDGHEPCGLKPEYTNSVKPYLSFSHPVDGGSFHPNAAGQRALATVLACYLDEYPTIRNPYINQQAANVPISWPPAQPKGASLLPIPGWGQPLAVQGQTSCS